MESSLLSHLDHVQEAAGRAGEEAGGAAECEGDHGLDQEDHSGALQLVPS